MHHKIWIFGIIMVLLIGCASKEEKALMQVYEKKKFYHQKLQKTEKLQLYDEDITKVLVTATYLNEKNSNALDKPDEVFIVSIYFEESENRSFDQEGYRLTLNGNTPKSITVIDESDTRLKDISFISEWNYLYMVTFPYVSNKSFTLIFDSELYGKGELYFAKVAKYTLSKKIF